MKIQWIGGATVLLQFNNLKILCDPVLCSKDTMQDYRYFKSIRMTDPVYDEYTLQNIDFLLITHNHLDHFDDIAQSRVSSNIAIVNKYNDKINSHKQITLNNYETYTGNLKDIKISITAIPATHGRNQIIGNLVGKNIGYLIILENKTNKYVIYITGDDVFKKRKRHLVDMNIDIIIAYAGAATIGNNLLGKILGRITNNRNDLIKLNKVYNPKYLVPVHFGTFSHYQDKNYIKESIGNNVLVLVPGESIEI